MKAQKRSTVSVADFFETAQESLDLHLVAGAAGLTKPITEAAINRPGLALSGFFQYFAHRRIQVVGLAEYTYLQSLPVATRSRNVRDFFKRRIPCVVCSRNKAVSEEMRKMAEHYAVPVFRTSLVTKNFINAATIIMENLMAPQMKMLGTMVEIMGIGVLIEGDVGMGKSETALGLIKKGHALVSDDITAVRIDSAGHLIGSPVGVTRYHMEIRGLGIIHVPSLFGVASVREEKKLEMVITLCKPGTYDEEDRSGARRWTKNILGIDLPRVYVPVAAGRDLTNLVETAALDMKLRRLGHDAAKELDEKLMMSLMNKGTDASE